MARGRAEQLIADRKDSQSSFKYNIRNKEYADLIGILFGTVSDRVGTTFIDMGFSSTGFFIEGRVLNIVEGGLIATAEWETLEA